MPAVAKNFVEQAECKSAVGAGTRRNPLIGALCGSTAVGIDADELGAPLLRRCHEVKVDQAGVGAVAAPEQNHVRVNSVGHFMAARPKIGRRRHAKHVLESLGNAVVHATGAMSCAADSRSEALRRPLRQHSRSATAAEKRQRS